jgi:Tfp pilus assembly protein PilN
MRELALVLPDKVWVTQVDGKTAGAAADGAAAGSSSTTPAPAPTTGTAAAATSGGSTTLMLSGCAPSQKSVAETMVRLRSLAGAEEVNLKTAQKAAAGESGAAGAAADGGSASAGCGESLSFDAEVTFATTSSEPKKDKSVPSRLGGGS